MSTLASKNAQGASATGQLHMTVTCALRWAGRLFRVAAQPGDSASDTVHTSTEDDGQMRSRELEANTDAGLVVAFRFPFSHMCRAPPQLTSSWLRYSGRSAPPYCTGERPPSGSTQNHRQADLCNFKITLPGTSSMKFLHKK